jgi:hypothetical protein
MNYYHLLGSLNDHLKRSIEIYFQQRPKDENERGRLNELAEKIKAMIAVFKKEISKVKNIKLKETEYNRLLAVNNKNKDKLLRLNNSHREAINNLKEGLNIFKLSSTQKTISEYSIARKDFINLALRVNSNYKFPKEFEGNVLPSAFNGPSPSEEKEMRFSILKFSNQRLLEPILKPSDNVVKKGTLLDISYPDSTVQGVFYKYTILSDFIPSYFSGTLVRSTY